MVSVVLPITTPQEIAALAKGEIGIEALAIAPLQKCEFVAVTESPGAGW